MKAVLLAGGLGTRLAEETDRRPKPMVEIGGRPILWHIMKIYNAYGVRDFIICAGYRSHIIKEYFINYYYHLSDITIDLKDNTLKVHDSRSEDWRVTIVETGADTLTGGRLKRIKPYVAEDEAFFATYGDGVADIDVQALYDLHHKAGRMATMTVVNPPGRFGAVDLDRDAVTLFREKPETEEAYINGGFFVLTPGVLDLIDGDGTSFERTPLEAMVENGQLNAYRHRGFWQPMDTLREKQHLENLWAAGKAPWKVWS